MKTTKHFLLTDHVRSPSAAFRDAVQVIVSADLATKYRWSLSITSCHDLLGSLYQEMHETLVGLHLAMKIPSSLPHV